MNFDQILIRVGLDAKSVKGGLQELGSLVQGWGTSMAKHLRGAVGGLFAFGALEEGLRSVRERLLDIGHASQTLFGNSSGTNFVQSLMRISTLSGQSYDAFEKPLKTFSVLLGNAAAGSVQAREKLIAWGIANKETNFETLTLTAGLAKMSDQYHMLNTAEEKNAMLSDLVGKGFGNLVPIIEQGSAAISKMNEGNFFTKFSESSVGWAHALGHFFDSWKAIGIGGVNLITSTLDTVATTISAVEKTASGKNPFSKQFWVELAATQKEADAAHTDALGQNIQQENEISEAKERQKELQAEIDDRGKSSLDAMADRARKLMGLSKTPSGLESVFTLTPALRAAYAIKYGLEKPSEAAFARGDIATAQRLQSEALNARAGLGGSFSRRDIDPQAKAVTELQNLNRTLTVSGVAIKSINAGGKQ